MGECLTNSTTQKNAMKSATQILVPEARTTMEQVFKGESHVRRCRAVLVILATGLCCLCAAPTWAAFTDDLTACTVQGYIYQMDGLLTFKRVDHCTGVRAEVMDNALILTSLRRQVAVVPPSTRGQVSFWYRWGRGEAHLSTESIPAASWPITRPASSSR